MKYLIDTDWIIDHFRGVELITQKLEGIALKERAFFKGFSQFGGKSKWVKQ